MKTTTLLPAALMAALMLTTATATAQDIIPKPTSYLPAAGEFALASSDAAYIKVDKQYRPLFSQMLNEIFDTQIPNDKNGDARIRIVQTGTKDDGKQAPYDVKLQGYQLTVKSSGITLEAATPMGLYYGLQTLAALMDESKQNNKGTIAAATITDTPNLPYRGLMIDCSRHFWTIDFLKKQIDMMSRLKLDRLHLHLTDAAGWRMEIKRYPKLTEKTAFRTKSNWREWWESGLRTYCDATTPGAYGGFYTQKELKELVDYAARHFITIIPEIEMPGHSEEATYAYPQLSCDGKTSGELCIGNEETYKFLTDVLKEVMKVFPSPYIHVGGDEAGGDRWKKCPRCQALMKEKGLQTTQQLQAYLMHRINEFLEKNGRHLVGWDEMMDGGLPEGSTVMAWRGPKQGWMAAAQQHQTIFTPGEYYLDYYQDAPGTQPIAMGSFSPLETTYGFNPVPDTLAASVKPYIIGVQGNLWTERVETPEHAEYMIYPRIMAIAETGWTGGKKDYDDFHRRALSLVAQMQKEGYHPFDLAHEIGERPESRQLVDHEARGKKVTYLSPYHEGYAGVGDSTLTDGRLGSWKHGSPEWQGFIRRGRLNVVVDMGATTDLHDISCEFMQFRGPEIYFPSAIDIAVSDDGEHFTTIDHHTFADDPKEYFIHTYTWKGEARGRYIRYQAAAQPQGGWVFADEIIVNKKQATAE